MLLFVSSFEGCSFSPLASVAGTWQTVCSRSIDFQSVFGVLSTEMFIGILFLDCILEDDMVLWALVDEKISCTSLWNTL